MKIKDRKIEKTGICFEYDHLFRSHVRYTSLVKHHEDIIQERKVEEDQVTSHADMS